jgi:hypothetical protein
LCIINLYQGGAAVIDQITKMVGQINHLHDDVSDVSKEIYAQLVEQDYTSLKFSSEFYSKYSDVLTVLDHGKYIRKEHACTSKDPISIQLICPTYILYMCNLSEDSKKMACLIEHMEKCSYDQSINGDELKQEIGLNISVIRAVFDIYKLKGHGIISNAIGVNLYIGRSNPR